MNKKAICVSVCAGTTEGLAEKIENAANFADLVEIRFDCLSPEELHAADGPRNAVNSVIDRFPDIKFLVTLRSKAEGGKREIPAEERNSFWNSGFSAEMVDFENDIEERPFECEWKSKIVSTHLSSVEDLPHSLASNSADIIKIACPVSDCADGLEVWKFLSDTKKNPDSRPVIPIAMGEAGKWTRILGPAFGAPLTYASLESGNETAEGQITARDLRDVYRVRELERDTEIYGLVGNPVRHSLSPFIHNAAFSETKQNAVYIPFQLNDLSCFFERMVRPATREIDWNLKGFSVTIPFKLQIMKELDFVDETSREIGAVNTVHLVDNQLVGLNTDAAGFIEPLKSAFGNLKNVEVAVIGAGGAARACVYALKKEGALPTVFARNTAAASTIAYDFGCRIEQLSTADNVLGSHLIAVNATPAGTVGRLENESLISAGQMKNLQLVYDLVYNPYETLLLKEANKIGLPSVNGLEMLISQASKQHEIWTGNKAPRKAMSLAALSRLS